MRQTPIIVASGNGHLNVLKLLLDHGANVNDRCAVSVNGLITVFMYFN